MSLPAPTSSETNSLTIPELPDIVLSPTPLNRGPFAAIYRGWDRTLRCDVIAKVQRITDDSVAMERFRREAVVMGRLRHPNIVALYRFYEGNPAALVMEYVPGKTLASLIAADGWLPAKRVASIIEDIAAALDCAHAQNIVHRDVKPSNILLPRHGPARLTDFGVAHIDDDTPLTVMGDMLGTIEYASPEQVHGNETPDGRSDVYSLAAVTYFALTGTPPFRATDNSTQAQLSVMHRQVFAEPPPLRFHREDLSPEIEAVVLRGLAKAPESRYPSAGQLAAALRSAAEAEHSPEQRARTSAMHRTGALAGALAGIGLLLLAGFGWWEARHPSPVPGSAPISAVSQAPLPVPHPLLVTIPPRPAPVPQKSVPPKPVPAKPAIAAVKPLPPKPVPPKPVPTAVKLPQVVAKPMKPVTKLAPAAKKPPKKTIVALAPAPKPNTAPQPNLTPKPAAAPAQGWLYVYADQDIAIPGHPPHIGRVRAQAIYVDGRLIPALAAGQWALLPAGPHHISFFPDVRSGFSPRAGVLVTLSAGTRVVKQILLPRMTNAAASAAAHPPAPQVPVSPIAWLYVYGVRSGGQPGQKPGIVRIPAQSVMLDGHPIPDLADGQWARVTAGAHVLTFIPHSDAGVGTATLTIHLSPQAHLLQQVPLPAVSTRPVPSPVTPSPAITPPVAASPPQTVTSPTVAPPVTPSPHLRNP